MMPLQSLVATTLVRVKYKSLYDASAIRSVATAQAPHMLL